MKKFFQEFKEFALKGNVLDMAIGVIIGGAFSGLVTSLTDCFINPLIGMYRWCRSTGQDPSPGRSVYRLRFFHYSSDQLHHHGIYHFPSDERNQKAVITWKKGRRSSSVDKKVSVLLWRDRCKSNKMYALYI